MVVSSRAGAGWLPSEMAPKMASGGREHGHHGQPTAGSWPTGPMTLARCTLGAAETHGVPQTGQMAAAGDTEGDTAGSCDLRNVIPTSMRTAEPKASLQF